MSFSPAPKKIRRSEVRRIQDDSVLCEDDDVDSPFTLFFVKFTDGNPTDVETKNLEKTFEVAKCSGIMPEWINSDDVERLQSSDDFFVLPCFRGKLFRKLQAKKIKLFGPPIILESIDEQKQLPNWNHPVYSSVFEGAKICFTSLELDTRRELQEKIGWMSGVVGASLYHESTHLIAGKANQTEKYKAAVNNSIKLMKKEWVEDLWKTSETTMGKFSALIKEAITAYELRVFEGLELAVSSIDGADRNRLIQLVEEHGGTIPGNMSRSKCSHLITEKTSGQKYIKATEWKSVHIVQTRWVRKCIDLGHLIDEKKYHPKYSSTDHIRCSTPKKDASVSESIPDLSSISGPGGRLNNSSFNSSSALTPMDLSYRQSCSSFVSSSYVSSTTIESPNVTIGRMENVEQMNGNSSTPLARTFTVPLARHSTTKGIQELSVVHQDPIDDLRKRIDKKHIDIFENCLFYICGIDQTKTEQWKRFLNETGATRVSKFESATNVIVVTPNKQEKITIRKFSQQEDITIVTVKWVEECIKRGKMIPVEGYEWNEIATENMLSPNSCSLAQVPFNPSEAFRGYDCSSLEHTITSKIFESHSYCVHPSFDGKTATLISRLIYNNGGILEKDIKKAEFVVFGNSALMHELMAYDTVITEFFIDTCVGRGELLTLWHPLFIPLPQPPFPIFDHYRFVLKSDNQFIRDYVKKIIEDNGGTVIDKMDSKSFKIMLSAGRLHDEQKSRCRILDFSWIISSMSRCRLQPMDQHLYQENSKPLENFQREDDVWIKSTTRERDSTEDIEVEIEERHRVSEYPVDTGNSQKGNISNPYENTYFPDLRKPYKMNLNLDAVSEYINNMESPSRDTQDSLTTSRVGSILRKAVVNTGRQSRKEKDNSPATCEILQSRIAMADNRRTVSSTPVMVRDVDRSMRYMPMDESFAGQNQEYEELNRHYALHPHFLLSVSNMDPQLSQELKESIKQMGGHIEKDFNRDVTHLISNNMLRTPKVLSSIAAGKWCLTPEYITKSAEAGRWLSEEPFEWCPDKLAKDLDYQSPKDRESRKIMEKIVSVCGLWRIRVSEMPITCSVRMENRHNGAFSDWCCVIHHDDKKAQHISSILEAGGAFVHSITEYIELTTLKPNKILASKDFNWNPQSARMLKADNLPIYIFDVIYEYLINKDNLNFLNFLHPVYKQA